jgi:hypothetical protein
MKKSWVLAACLFAGAAGAQPSEQSLEQESPPPEPAPSLSLWVEPLGPLALTPLMASVGNTFVMVPLGMHLPLSPSQDLVLELTPIFSRQRCESRCSSQMLALAVGTSWLLLPNNSRGGLFLQPKLIGVLAHDSRGVDVVMFSHESGAWSEAGAQLSLGLDVGYRLRFGHLFLEFVLGGSVGRGWNVPSSSQSLFFSLLDWPERHREDKGVWDLNLHLLRVGASF